MDEDSCKHQNGGSNAPDKTLALLHALVTRGNNVRRCAVKVFLPLVATQALQFHGYFSKGSLSR
jgi:hypothetical protein